MNNAGSDDKRGEELPIVKTLRDRAALLTKDSFDPFAARKDTVEWTAAAVIERLTAQLEAARLSHVATPEEEIVERAKYWALSANTVKEYPREAFQLFRNEILRLAKGAPPSATALSLSPIPAKAESLPNPDDYAATDRLVLGWMPGMNYWDAVSAVTVRRWALDNDPIEGAMWMPMPPLPRRAT